MRNKDVQKPLIRYPVSSILMLLYQPGYQKPKPPPGACKHKVQAPGGGFGFLYPS